MFKNIFAHFFSLLFFLPFFCPILALSKVKIYTLEQGSIFVEITTDRLLLRSIALEDLKDYKQAMTDSINMKNYGSGVLSEEEVTNIVVESTQLWESGNVFGAFSVFLKETKEFIGQVSIELKEKEAHVMCPDLGYFVKNEYWGKGFGTEMAQAIIDQYIPKLLKKDKLMKGYSLKLITATALPENKGSISILEKVGFKYFDTIERYGKLRNFYSINIQN